MSKWFDYYLIQTREGGQWDGGLAEMRKREGEREQFG